MLQGADPLDLLTLKTRYASGRLRPSQLVASILERIARRGKDPTWIELAPRAELEARAAELERRSAAELPLYGIPFAIKDNIDCAGLPTTAACPEFAYRPERLAHGGRARSSPRARSPIGKTNLDQFATGLVGVRSPYGVPANRFDPAYIPGGSSSGSAVAVAAGLVELQRSAPTPPARVASPPRSTTSSASSPRAGC